MLTNEEIKRYARHLSLDEVGEDGQQKLKAAKVLVVGAGGLGCPVLQYLSAAGIGTIGIIDGDIVEQSNLQRQVLYSVNDVGSSKAEVAAKKLVAQNPLITIVSHSVYLTPINALEILSGYDLVIDGSDNFATRYLVNDACVILNKILVFGSIYKFEGQISVFNYLHGPTYRCLYPDPPRAGEVPNCAEIGVLGVLPGICGTLMANEALKIILGRGEILSGKLLAFNAMQLEFNVFTIELNPLNKRIKKLVDYNLFCNTVAEISAEELKRKISVGEDFQLVDVREENEYRQKNIGGLLIPLKTLGNNLDKISRDKEVVIHCRSGARSLQAAGFLLEKGYKKVYSLKNGLLDF